MEQGEVGGSGEARLKILLRGLEPELRPGRFVFTTVEQPPSGVECIASIVEDEGLTVVLRQDDADRLGLAYGFVAAMITLRIHSALDAVGLTARVASVLATAGISCNVIAGHFHDHLFVPVERGQEAVEILGELSHTVS